MIHIVIQEVTLIYSSANCQIMYHYTFVYISIVLVSSETNSRVLCYLVYFEWDKKWPHVNFVTIFATFIRLNFVVIKAI